MTSQVNGWAWLKSTSLAYRVLIDGIHTIVLYFMSPMTLEMISRRWPFELEVVLGERLDMGALAAHVVGADRALPDLDLAEELLVDDVGLRRDRHHPGLGERLGDGAGAEVVIGMGVGEIDRREVLARLQDLGDDPVGARQRPLRVDEHRVGLARDDDRSDLERFLVAEEDLGR